MSDRKMTHAPAVLQRQPPARREAVEEPVIVLMLVLCMRSQNSETRHPNPFPKPPHQPPTRTYRCTPFPPSPGASK